MPAAQADWTREITSNQCLNGVALAKWAVVYIGKNAEPVKNFVALMIKLAPKMGIRVAQPAMVELPNDRTETYVKVGLFVCSVCSLFMAAIVVRIRTIGPIRTICPKWYDCWSNCESWSKF